MRSKRGAASRNASCSARVQYFMTYSTPARLYQLRLNRTISWAAGRCLTKRWKYHSVASRSLGLPGATVRTSRGLRCAAMRFIVPSLPAASRPSRITSTLRPRAMTCRCSLTSSICRRRNSRAYFFLPSFRVDSIRLLIPGAPIRPAALLSHARRWFTLAAAAKEALDDEVQVATSGGHLEQRPLPGQRRRAARQADHRDRQRGWIAAVAPGRRIPRAGVVPALPVRQVES